MSFNYYDRTSNYLKSEQKSAVKTKVHANRDRINVNGDVMYQISRINTQIVRNITFQQHMYSDFNSNSEQFVI